MPFPTIFVLFPFLLRLLYCTLCNLTHDLAAATGSLAVVFAFHRSEPTNQDWPLDRLALRISEALVTCRACRFY